MHTEREKRYLGNKCIEYWEWYWCERRGYFQRVEYWRDADPARPYRGPQISHPVTKGVSGCCPKHRGLHFDRKKRK